MTETARPVYAAEPLDEAARRAVRGARVLFLVAESGNATQEILKPREMLEHNGCAVSIASLRGGTARFDPICNLIACAELGWDRTLRLLLRAMRRGSMHGLPSLSELRAEDGSLDHFDALVVPGGHGPVYAAFLRDPLLLEACVEFYRKSRALGLMCHSPFAASLIEEHGLPLVARRLVTCWPRTQERFWGSLPFLGDYLMPFGSPVAELLERAGADVRDARMRAGPVHAAIDGGLVTCRGPWSTAPFVSALLQVIAAGRRSADALSA